MGRNNKSTQLQLRVAPLEKREIQRRAKAAGVTVSAWVLGQLLPQPQMVFEELVHELAKSDQGSTPFALAAIHDFLARQTGASLELAVHEAPRASLLPFLQAYLAAMIEHTAAKKRAHIPDWVMRVGPIPNPYFATELVSLRLHLLTQSPPAFRRRNLFVDEAVGARV